MGKEIWKDIQGYEGIYQISNNGNVRRLTYTNNKVNKDKAHYIKPTDNGKGYLIVGLKVNGKRKSAYVHRLVATAFCKNDNAGNVVNHKDFNTKNNNANNLEWLTQKQNVRYSANNMKHEKTICKPTNTGEKYITKKGNRFVVRATNDNKEKSFKTLEEAVLYRNIAKKGA